MSSPPPLPSPSGKPGRRWPMQTDYQEAIEYPAFCFLDETLRVLQPLDRTPFGMPLPITGHFTNVYRMGDEAGNAFAIRLFLQENPLRNQHWNALVEHLQSLEALPDCLVIPEYLPEGFYWRGERFPVVRQPWVTGVPLNAYIEKHLYDTARLVQLCEGWIQLIQTLRRAQFVHGDLQHGNILVDENTQSIRLIDYDASFVPALAGTLNRETGHPSFQHPRRSPSDYGPMLDRFSALAIYAALRVLVVVPEIWFRLDNGDNLLFQREDFIDPTGSRAFALILTALRHHQDERQCIIQLQRSCSSLPRSAPPIDSL